MKREKYYLTPQQEGYLERLGAEKRMSRRKLLKRGIQATAAGVTMAAGVKTLLLGELKSTASENQYEIERVTAQQTIETPEITIDPLIKLKEFVDSNINTENDPDYWNSFFEFSQRALHDERSRFMRKIENAYGSTIDIYWPSEVPLRTYSMPVMRYTHTSIPGYADQQILETRLDAHLKINPIREYPEPNNLIFPTQESVRDGIEQVIKPGVFQLNEVIVNGAEVPGAWKAHVITEGSNEKQAKVSLDGYGYMNVIEEKYLSGDPFKRATREPQVF